MTQPMSDLARTRWLVPSGHLVAWLLIIGSIAGMALAAAVPVGGPGPMNRQRIINIIVDSSLWPIIGLFLGTVLAAVFAQRRLQWTYAVLSGLVALIMLVVVPLYALDVLQVRAGLRPDMRTLFHLNVLRNAAALVVYGLVLGTLCLTSVRALRRTRAGLDSGPGLVAGSRGGRGGKAEAAAVDRR